MTLDLDATLTIAGMALITFLLRAGGYWLMGLVPLTPRVRRGLEALPGAVLISLVAPAVVAGGWLGALCVAVTATVMRLTKRDFLAVFAGMALAALVRQLGS
jgi:uncharacterized membrane protein